MKKFTDLQILDKRMWKEPDKSASHNILKRKLIQTDTFSVEWKNYSPKGN